MTLDFYPSGFELRDLRLTFPRKIAALRAKSKNAVMLKMPFFILTRNFFTIALRRWVKVKQSDTLLTQKSLAI